jgi:hypothetical protein
MVLIWILPAATAFQAYYVLATAQDDFLCHTKFLILLLVCTMNLFSVLIRDAISEPGCTGTFVVHLQYILNLLTCKVCAR